jgi:diguanylate cyclase (GGDEF)-like protein
MEFGRTPDEIENKRKRLLIYAFVALGGSFLFIFGIVSIIHNRYFLGCILFIFLLISLLTASIAYRSTNVQHVSILLSSVLYILSSYLLISGGNEGTGVYWSYSISMLMVLLVGPKLGCIFMGLYIIVNSIFIFSSFSYQYSNLEAIRIIITSITLFVLILASEWIRMGSYSAISEASEIHRQLANTDPLTGLLNRHGLKVKLDDYELNLPTVVTILDVDKFKHINDNYGHDFGDLVLSKLSSLLTKTTKGGDLIARWGGEEFVLILYGTTIDSAKALVEKIKKEFQSHLFSFDDKLVSVTFSAGLANLNSKSQFELAIKKADQHLYEAKNSGRNLVVANTGEC